MLRKGFRLCRRSDQEFRHRTEAHRVSKFLADVVAERWVESCKREITDHVIVFDEDHLRRLLRDDVSYYNTERIHTVVRDSPEGRAIEARSSPDAKVVGLPRVGDLHHRYVGQEAA